jgi:hypothetical protein
MTPRPPRYRAEDMVIALALVAAIVAIVALVLVSL